MTRDECTGTTRDDLYDAWIAGYEAAAGVGFFNERFDGQRQAILERFEKWLRERDEATS